MEQIVLYLAILAALAGFGMGLANLAGPFLRKNNISLPAINLGALLHRETGDEDDIDSLIRDAEDSDSYFSSRRSLLSGRGESSEEGEDEELDEELAGVLDQVAEEEVVAEDGEDALEEEESEDDPAIYTVSAEASDAEEQEEEEQEESAGAELDLDAVLEDDTESLALDEDAEAGEEEEAETETDSEAVAEEAEAEEAQSEESAVQTVAAGGNESDDMMSFFDEAADAGQGAIAPWREGLPEVTIEELLAEARALKSMIRGTKSDAA